MRSKCWVVPITQAPMDNVMIPQDIRQNVGLCRLLRRPGGSCWLTKCYVNSKSPVIPAPSGTQYSNGRCGRRAFFAVGQPCAPFCSQCGESISASAEHRRERNPDRHSLSACFRRPFAGLGTGDSGDAVCGASTTRQNEQLNSTRPCPCRASVRRPLK
jgi:hypothetical protein